MRYLRWVGLVSSLLMSGVLGGLMAPLSSEAGTPTLTIQVDSGLLTNVPLSTCAIPSGYTACFALQTGGTYSGTNAQGITRGFTIKNYGTSLARLLVTDTNGSGLDNITLTTVEFAPSGTAPVSWGSTTANTGNGIDPTRYGEVHNLKVVVTHKFDQVPNPKTVGTSARYQFALRTSGMFQGGGATGATASGDFVKFVGNGIFGSTSTTIPLLGPVPSGATCNAFNSLAADVNYCPLKRTLGVTSALTSSYSTTPPLEQVPTYPSYVCDNGTNCTPTVILQMTATLNGPDSWILSSSNDAAGGSCNQDASAPSSTSAIPCHESKKGKKSLDGLISSYFATQAIADAAAFAAAGAESTPACVGDQCLCQDPDTCPTTPPAGVWTPTGSMSTARVVHTATLLPTGQVLVAGGQTSAGIDVATAERYDPATHVFTSTSGSMQSARESHTATLLPNGRILITGGFAGGGNCCSNGVLALAELYNTTASGFSAADTFSSTGSMGTARTAHTATVLPNGTILIVGGVSNGDTVLASAELYDPATETFSPTGSMAVLRASHTATLLPSGKVLVAGGSNLSSGVVSSTELYDPTTGAFSPTSPMGTARQAHTATLLGTGQVLVVGGLTSGGVTLATAELYDPATGTFRPTGSMAMPRDARNALLLPTGRVLVTGGASGSTLVPTAEVYDPPTGMFFPVSSMTTPRYLQTVTLLPNGLSLITGGFNSLSPNVYLASAELYDPTAGTVTATGSSHPPRSLLSILAPSGQRHRQLHLSQRSTLVNILPD